MTSRNAYNNPDRKGALGLPYHYELIADRRRVVTLKRAITLAAMGRRVLESGAGSGILSILAARNGAQAVYATEPDPKIARFARENVARSGCSGIVRLIEKDTRDVTLHDLDGSKVDMVLAEHLSTWQVTEPQIPIMNHINKFLATEAAIRIPAWSSNCAELARSDYCFEDVVELRTPYFGFTGLPRPSLLSDPVEFQRVDFKSLNPISISRSAKLQATRNGTINGLRLTSPLSIFQKIRFQSSDSLVPPVIVPLEEDIEVSEGDIVEARVEYRCETDWSYVRCSARVLSGRSYTNLCALAKAGVAGRRCWRPMP